MTNEAFIYSAQVLNFYLKHVKARTANNCTAGLVCHNVFDMEYSCRCDPVFLHSMKQLQQVLLITIAGIYERLGWYDEMKKIYQTSLQPPGYVTVKNRRSKWFQQRAVMREQGVKTHFATFASRHTSNLDDLLLSASLAMIDIEVRQLCKVLSFDVLNINFQVLGMGTLYRECGDKVKGYYQYLTSPHLSEDDVVVLIDAYDVLLLPRARHIARVLLWESETPIVFGSEAGVYQDFGGKSYCTRCCLINNGCSVTAFYSRGIVKTNSTSLDEWNHMTHKYLNSGTIVGRVGQMRDMFAWLLSFSDAIKDDQRLSIAYHLQNPDLTSLDSENRMFMALFKMNRAVHGFAIDEALHAHYGRLVDKEENNVLSTVGVIHCNFAYGSLFLKQHVDELRRIKDAYYSGPDGPALIRAVNAIHDGSYDAAMELLNSPEVMVNRTSQGGVNNIGDALIDLIARRTEE